MAKNIQTGQYTSPITELIWPENNVPGTAITQNAFNLFGQLKDGSVLDKIQSGQLKPWPGVQAPSASKICTGNELNAPAPAPSAGSTTPPPTTAGAPVADAGTALISQLAGSLITLTGEKNTNLQLTDSQLSFTWTGPTGITINNAEKATMNFVNPWQITTAPTKKTFTLKICLISDAYSCGSATVDVTTDKIQDTVAITSWQFSTRQGGTVTVTAKSNNVLTENDGANLQIQLSGTGNFVAMTPDSTVAGQYTYTGRSISKQQTSIAVKSTHNSNVATSNAPF